MQKVISAFGKILLFTVVLSGGLVFGAEGDAPKSEKKIEVPAMKVEKGDWCVEHGVPESVCSRCSKEAATEAKKKEDWCKKHGRAESQCFVCHPELKDKWAALKPKE
jgi:hypothetical protein